MNAYLVLQDGTIFKGISMGATGRAIGEVVFNTSMVGYQESLTDPSNKGLLLAQTFPLIGNYGVNKYGNETDTVHASGYIVREMCDAPSNFRCEGTLDSFLKENGVVGICDIDTRHLTKLIREKGVMNGLITTDEIGDIDAIKSELAKHEQVVEVANVSCKQSLVFKAENEKHSVAILDIGVKGSLIQALNDRDCSVTVVPYNFSELDKFDGVVVSDGAGDPMKYVDSITVVKNLLDTKKPTLGIGLGHLIMALANDISVCKMHYGHRGANQPVRNLSNDRTYITMQNHGYIVDTDAVKATITYVNANDKSVEGICYSDTACSVAFTPDTKVSMVSTSYIYDDFVALLK